MSAAPTVVAYNFEGDRRRERWLIAFTVTLATFMEILDTSVANVALPHIAGGLSASINESTWVLTSYLVANGVVLPLSAGASSLIGRKRFYMACVAVFTVSSVLCGLAPSLAMLILFRVIQGAAGGGLQPSEQAILVDTFPSAERGMAFAVYGMAVLVAPSIGPTLGGYITDNFSWRWIFFINVPVGILSLLLTRRLIRDPAYRNEAPLSTKKPVRPIDTDWLGAGLIIVGVGCLQVVLDKGQENDWFSSSFILAFTLISAVALAVFIAWEWNCNNPILDLHLLRDRSFSTAASMVFALGLVLYGVTALLPLFSQETLGYTAELSVGSFIWRAGVDGYDAARWMARLIFSGPVDHRCGVRRYRLRASPPGRN